MSRKTYYFVDALLGLASIRLCYSFHVLLAHLTSFLLPFSSFLLAALSSDGLPSALASSTFFSPPASLKQRFDHKDIKLTFPSLTLELVRAWRIHCFPSSRPCNELDMKSSTICSLFIATFSALIFLLFFPEHGRERLVFRNKETHFLTSSSGFFSSSSSLALTTLSSSC